MRLLDARARVDSEWGAATRRFCSSAFVKDPKRILYTH